MHRTRTIVSVIVVAVGLVWIGQGTGFLAGRSFMVGDPLWTVLGLVAVAVGIGFLGVEVRRLRRR
jgi:hypothetical protein